MTLAKNDQGVFFIMGFLLEPRILLVLYFGEEKLTAGISQSSPESFASKKASFTEAFGTSPRLEPRTR